MWYMNKAIASHKTRIAGIMAVLAISPMILSCKLAGTKEPAVGIQKTPIKDGSTEILVTARASDNAVQKDSPAMMRSTSCRAARDLLSHELQKKEYKSLSTNFASIGVNLILKGKYCQILSVYHPDGLSPAIRRRSVNLDRIR